MASFNGKVAEHSNPGGQATKPVARQAIRCEAINCDRRKSIETEASP